MVNMRLLPATFLGMLISGSVAVPVLGGTPIYAPDHLAIKGYDPIAYFADGHAEQGVKDFQYQWHGATWEFSSAAHREAFIADPDKYAPQYGGYCALAVAQGQTADADPTIWSMLDGKLYLNQSEKVRKQWLLDAAAFIEAADANWQKIQDNAGP